MLLLLPHTRQALLRSTATSLAVFRAFVLPQQSLPLMPVPCRFLVVQKSRTVTTGGGGRAVRCSGWSPCMGSAGGLPKMII